MFLSISCYMLTDTWVTWLVFCFNTTSIVQLMIRVMWVFLYNRYQPVVSVSLTETWSTFRTPLHTPHIHSHLATHFITYNRNTVWDMWTKGQNQRWRFTAVLLALVNRTVSQTIQRMTTQSCRGEDRSHSTLLYCLILQVQENTDRSCVQRKCGIKFKYISTKICLWQLKQLQLWK